MNEYVMNKGLICIPTYNEKDNIEILIPQIMELNHPLDILVIDDGSPDGTAAKVKEMMNKYEGKLHILERSGKLGLGSAYIAGFKWSLKREYDCVLEMDADFSHSPKYLKEFLREIETSDLVLGSRYKDGKISVINWDWKRLVLSYCGNIYARFITGLPVSDATGGFKCFRTSSLKALDLDSIGADGYSFQIETTFKIWKKKLKIAEIPIIFTDRTVGVSKMSGTIITEALFVLVKLRLGLK